MSDLSYAKVKTYSLKSDLNLQMRMKLNLGVFCDSFPFPHKTKQKI